MTYNGKDISNIHFAEACELAITEIYMMMKFIYDDITYEQVCTVIALYEKLITRLNEEFGYERWEG